MLEVPCFFRYLKESAATDERIKEVEGLLSKMRRRTYNVIETLKYCSPLGPLLRSLRQQRSSSKGPSVGQKTIEKLSDAGIRTLAEILEEGEEGLIKKGIRKNFAKQLVDYARRRMNG